LTDESDDSLAIALPMNSLAYNQLLIAYFSVADWLGDYCFSVVFHILISFLGGWLAMEVGRWEVGVEDICRVNLNKNFHWFQQ
jgi:hypothetical protein